MLNLAICDDEREFIRSIGNHLHTIMRRTMLEYEVFEFLTGAELVEVVQRGQQFDIIFLDIRLQDTNGKLVAEKLRRMDRIFKLVFISHLDDEVYETFPYDTTCFIPKARLEEKIEKEMEWILAQLEEERKSRIAFEVFENKRVKAPIRLLANEIVFFQSESKIVTMYTRKQKEPFNLGRLKIDDLEADFAPRGFFRSHRAALVNMEFVYSYEDDYVIMDGGHRVLLSRRRKAKLEELYFAKTAGIT